jgi:hypothetical protein
MVDRDAHLVGPRAAPVEAVAAPHRIGLVGERAGVENSVRV